MQTAQLNCLNCGKSTLSSQPQGLQIVNNKNHQASRKRNTLLLIVPPAIVMNERMNGQPPKHSSVSHKNALT